MRERMREPASPLLDETTLIERRKAWLKLPKRQIITIRERGIVMTKRPHFEVKETIPPDWKKVKDLGSKKKVRLVKDIIKDLRSRKEKAGIKKIASKYGLRFLDVSGIFIDVFNVILARKRGKEDPKRPAKGVSKDIHELVLEYC